MLSKNKQHRVLKSTSILMVFAFFSFMSFKVFFPIALSSADSSASATLELNVEPTLEMALSETSLSLAYNNETDILPTSAGVTATGTLDVYVATNGASGYNLSMYAPEHADMKNIDATISNSISSTAGGASLAKDTWGFYNNALSTWVAVGVGSGNSASLVENGSSVSVPCDLSTTAPTSCANGTVETTTVTFGANISDALPAGRYTNDVVFTAISNVPETRVSYTLNYNVNGGVGSIAPTYAPYPGTTGFASGSSLTPPSGKKFAGWALTSSASTADYTASETVTTLSLVEDAIAAGQSISETQGGVIQLYAVWQTTILYCSDSVHPTTSEGCTMADGKMWIYGNNGSNAAWTDLFTNATGASGHDATLISGKCPAGYSAPKKSDYDTLISSYSGGGLYTALGLSGGRDFWSSTENSTDAYFLYVYSSGAFTSSDVKSTTFYLLCVK